MKDDPTLPKPRSAAQIKWAQMPGQARYTLVVVLGSAGVVLVSGALAVSARLLEWGGLIGG
jgi:hypothetical protein